MQAYSVEYIGVIHSPFTHLQDMPIQPVGARTVEGEVVVEERFAPGLKDLDGFSHIYLIYCFHEARRTELEVVPFMDSAVHGVFATRSPLRPAHLGLSVVELLAVDGNRLRVRGLDILDGTPLIDIKPFIPQFDNRLEATSGWMQATRDEVERRRADERFT